MDILIFSLSRRFVGAVIFSLGALGYGGQIETNLAYFNNFGPFCKFLA